MQQYINAPQQVHHMLGQIFLEISAQSPRQSSSCKSLDFEHLFARRVLLPESRSRTRKNTRENQQRRTRENLIYKNAAEISGHFWWGQFVLYFIGRIGFGRVVYIKIVVPHWRGARFGVQKSITVFRVSDTYVKSRSCGRFAPDLLSIIEFTHGDLRIDAGAGPKV